MFEKVGALFVVGWVALSAVSAREFVDGQGRKIEATIQSVRGESVVLQREDGKRFVFPIVKLSKNDQEYIAEWRKENPEIKLSYRFEKEKTGSAGDSTKKVENWRWQITVENRGLSDIEDLTFEYEMYRQIHDRYSKGKKKGINGKLAGKAELSGIEAARSATFNTDSIRVSKVNSVSTSGLVRTYEKWNESLVGIKLTVKFRDRVVDQKEFGIVD